MIKHPQIDAKIDVRGGSRIALSFKNSSDRVAYLYQPNACEGGAVENNVFVARSEHEVARYIGMYVKRRSPMPADFLVLPARAERLVEVDLANAYELSPGSRYRVLYGALHGDPSDPATLWEVASNTVTISL